MFLGLDIGTSCVKAVVCDETGAVLAQASVNLPISRPQPLWSEQDPADWWSATNASVSQLPGELRRQVRGVGLAGQMHGATVLDAQMQPLRPAILWNDGRSAAECEELEAALPGLGAITGNRAMPGFTADCLETIDEIGNESAAEFRHAGGEELHACPCLNDHPAWIDALGRIINEEGQGWL